MDINQMYMIALTGDRDDEEALFRVLSERLRLFVEQRVEDDVACEDVVQESLAAIAERYRSVELSSSFAAWVYGVLQKKLQRYYRDKRYHRDRFEDSSTDRVSRTDPALRAALVDCLRELCRHNEGQARTLNLVFQGYTISETCSMLGLTPNACYIQLSRARAHVKACLEKKKVSL